MEVRKVFWACVVLVIVSGCRNADQEIRQTVLLSGRDLKSGNIITDADLRSEERDVSDEGGDFITAPTSDFVIGRKVTRDIPKGTLLKIRDVEGLSSAAYR